MAQITIEKLNFRYSNAKENAIEDVSLNIEDGQFVVLFGKSGCGKSTLLRNLKPLIRPFGTVTGAVFFNGQNIDQIDDRVQAEKIGFVMQNPQYQIVTDKVWHELAFGLENLGYPGDVIRVRVSEIAEYFGITDWYELPVDTLSGGQMQILNLAATMVMNPEVLILDEPTEGLDPIAAERFLEMVNKLHQDFGITVIISEHRLGGILKMADQIVMMDCGKVQYYGKPENIFGTGSLVDSIGNANEIKGIFNTKEDEEILKLLPYPMQIYYEVTCTNRWKQWKKEKGTEYGKEQYEIPLCIGEGRKWLTKINEDGYINRTIRDGDIKKINADGYITKNNDDSHITKTKNNAYDEMGQQDNQKTAIECKHVYFRYEKNAKDVLKNLSLKIRQGEIFALLGGNGVGKTTLISLFTQIKRAYHGKINISGKTAYLPQDVQTMFLYDTVKEELKDVSPDLISFLQMETLMERHPYDLSGGEQQKLGLAKVLKENPDILLLDEPTKAIDGIYKETLGELFKTLKSQGKTIVFVSHDIDFCGEFADRCGLIAQGEIVRVKEAGKFFSQSNFYTTTIHKMAGHIFENAVKKEDVLCYLMDGNIT